MRVLVTGGAGFVGSAVVRLLLEDPECSVCVVDNLSLTGSLDALAGCPQARCRVAVGDVRDRQFVGGVLDQWKPAAVLHLAAESHVDRSLDVPNLAVETNIIGTLNLLEESLRAWKTYPTAERARFRFVQVSTDEVFGTLAPDEPGFTADSPYRPRSPYSASKAGADHLVEAWHHSYGFPGLITHSANNLGPFQFPEKFVPVMITRALMGAPMPIYGDGRQSREWIAVRDHARAIRAAMLRGTPGKRYLLPSGEGMENRELARQIAVMVDELAPPLDSGPRENLLARVQDRPGHDRRYAIAADGGCDDLGWTAETSFQVALRETVQWYLRNAAWTHRVLSHAGGYARQGRSRS